MDEEGDQRTSADDAEPDNIEDNIFFKEQRGKLLEEARQNALVEGRATQGDSFELKGEGPKIGFESMAKTIAKRWKELPPDELERCKSLAKEDMNRYRTEMEGYQTELARRSRLERERAAAAAASAQNAATAAAASLPSQFGGDQSVQPQLSGLMPGQISMEQILAFAGGNPAFAASSLAQAQLPFQPQMQPNQIMNPAFNQVSAFLGGDLFQQGINVMPPVPSGGQQQADQQPWSQPGGMQGGDNFSSMIAGWPQAAPQQQSTDAYASQLAFLQQQLLSLQHGTGAAPGSDHNPTGPKPAGDNP